MFKKILLSGVLLFSFIALKAQSSNALNFDGVNDYVSINSLAPPLSSTANFTIEFKMKADLNDNIPQAHMFTVNPAAPGDNKFSIFLGDGSPTQTGKLGIYEFGGPVNFLISSQVIGDDSCHHIAYVRTGGIGEAFIDGVSIGTLVVGDAFLTNDRISLGQDWDNITTSNFYEGMIDDLRIWNVARTQVEIQTNINVVLTGSESGLIGYYRFNQGVAGGTNTGINTLDDITTNSYDGSLNGFALSGGTSNWVDGICEAVQVNPDTSENQLDFDGNNDFVEIDALAPSLSSASNFTIEFKMKADLNNNIPQAHMFTVNPTAPGDNKFSIFLGDGTATQTGKLGIYEFGGPVNFLISSQVIGDDSCHHIAYVRTGSIGEAFIDGVSIGTLVVGDAFLSTDRISLGQDWDNTSPSNFYEGIMDELRIWNVARTPIQIQANMNGVLTGTEPGLIAYYNFDHGIPGGSNPSETVLEDNTVNGFDGHLNNFSLSGLTSNWVIENCTIQNQQSKDIEDNLGLLVSIYPNPFSDVVKVTLSEEITADVFITDLSGRVVKKFQLNNELESVFDLSSVSSGVYSLTVLTKEGKLTCRIIKY